jgi:hypothetical protein
MSESDYMQLKQSIRQSAFVTLFERPFPLFIGVHGQSSGVTNLWQPWFGWCEFLPSLSALLGFSGDEL